jgi:hypothetical protein
LADMVEPRVVEGDRACYWQALYQPKKSFFIRILRLMLEQTRPVYAPVEGYVCTDIVQYSASGSASDWAVVKPSFLVSPRDRLLSKCGLAVQ